MLTPNIPQPTPEWSLPDRCHCDCLCAVVSNWDGDRRRGCGCCVGSCEACGHGVEGPLLYAGDQA